MKFANTKTYKLIKRNQFVFFLWQRIFDKEFKTNLKKMKNSFKSKEQVKREMTMLKDYWHCKPYHYVRYGLYDKDLTNDQLLDYIPSYYHYNFYTDPLYANIDVSLYNSKLTMYMLFKERGVRTPEVIAVVRNGKLMSLQGEKLDENSFLKKYNYETLFIKPEFGAGGTGIHVFSEGSHSSFLASLDKHIAYIVQCGIKQRNDINRINSSSVNTLRVVTQIVDNKARVCVCVMRMGRHGKKVDNSHQGGLSVEIDITNGSFKSYATAEHGGGYYPCHPDSGFVFRGSRIEGWDTIKMSIEKYALLFPELKELAWDVAITSDGIEMIELNLGYGIDHLQCTCGGMRRVLGIYPKK